ncbi:Mu transposase C-terminal domain-containing protein [Citrobacter freundii]|nr:Mu transposase C-terminal domain-containing protein [Citrobacter freundii]
MQCEHWITVQECIGLTGFPAAPANVRRKLECLTRGQNELFRKRPGSKAIEYHVSVLPPEVRAELLIRNGSVETSSGLINISRPDVSMMDSLRHKLWQRWENATDTQRKLAEKWHPALLLVDELIVSGLTVKSAVKISAGKFQISACSLRDKYYRVQKFAKSDWMAVLIDNRGGTRRDAMKCEFEETAWQYLLADYLRPEKPAFSKCYERLELAAREHGWVIPSRPTVYRRVQLLDPAIVIACREGENALARMFPSQRRTVANLHAMEWLNADGYQHNVRVRWYNGEELRPKTWFWQDVHSRKIVSYRTDVSENKDSIRLSLMDAIRAYGKPEHVTIDNTRAAANKQLSGGQPNRYRFKVREDDPVGILTMLGIKVHWTGIIGGKGWGQAKPVERAFGVGGLGEYVDKHPLLAGAFTGENTQSKPDNYGSRVVDVDTFLEALAEGVAMFNARVGRNTEMCKGSLSFDQAFERSYSKAMITRLTEEQIRQLMLPSEAVTVKMNGEFLLESGGTLYGRKNSYWNPALADLRKRKITVRFDPQNLHGEVACYDLEGRFICMAECRSAVAFGDTESGREHSRQRTAMIRHTKRAAKAQRRMSVIEMNDLLPKISQPAPPERHIVERVFASGNTVKKTQEVVRQHNENAVIFQTLMKKVGKGKK